jgi:chromosome segregation ATPase
MSTIDEVNTEIENTKKKLKELKETLKHLKEHTHYVVYKKTYLTYYQKNKEQILAKSKARRDAMKAPVRIANSELKSSPPDDPPVITDVETLDNTPWDASTLLETEKVLDLTNPVLHIAP